MSAPRPIAIVGSIGAGKTTLARSLAKHYGYTYLGADDVRLSVTGDPSDVQNPYVWEVLAQQAYDNLHTGIVLDSTGTALAYRTLIYELRCFTVRLECSWQIWKQREATRGRVDVHYPQWRTTTWASRDCDIDVDVYTDHLTPAQVLNDVLAAYTYACDAL